MAIVFPVSPTLNDTFVVGSITYKWDGDKWIGLGVTPADRLVEGSNSLEITAGNELIWTGGKVGVNQVTPIAILHAKSGANDGTLVSTFEGATNNKLNIRFDTFGPVLDVTAGDPLAFEIGGSEKMRLDGSGRLLKSGQAALTSTSLNHPIQVTAASDANAIAIIGRAADDVGELSFYEADKGTKLGELQYRQDHLNLRCRVGDIRFASGGTAETLRIDGSGRIAQGGRTPTNHGSPNLLLWGADTTLHLTSTGSVNNSSFAGIKFAVAGGSTGDYSKAGIFVQRQDSYNDLDMIFAFRSTNDADGVAISDEKFRITSGGEVQITNSGSSNGSTVQQLSLYTDNSGNGDNFTQRIAYTRANDTSKVFTAIDSVRTGTFNTDLVFSNDDGGVLGEKLRLISTGNVSIANGDLVVASGHGIDFSATTNSSGTMTSELLDDYEEGTWTPVLTGFTNEGTATGRVRDYIKIGNQVTVWFDIFQNSNNMSFSNGATITGLPFITSAIADDSFHTQVNVQYFRGGGEIVLMTAYVETTDTIVIRGASVNSDIRHIWGHVTYTTS